MNTFENTIMENGAFAPDDECSMFHNIFKYMFFQRRQKALLWSKGLNHAFTYYVISTKNSCITELFVTVKAALMNASLGQVYL